MSDPKTITKKILVDRIADECGLKRADVKQVIQVFLDAIVDELAEGNRLEFRDFGVFEVKTRAARTAQNPRTLERVEVPAKQTVKFKLGRKLRERVEDVAPGAASQIESKPSGKPSGKMVSTHKADSEAELKPEHAPDQASTQPSTQQG